MADASPVLPDAVPGTVEVSVPNNTPQPIPLCDQQPPPPAPFQFLPTYPAGWALVDTIREGSIIVEHVLIGGELYERRFRTDTGDSELRPLH